MESLPLQEPMQKYPLLEIEQKEDQEEEDQPHNNVENDVIAEESAHKDQADANNGLVHTNNMNGDADIPASPEPFHHPSSPINKNNDSLTHANLHLLDHSLTLTENGNGITSEAENALDLINDTSYVSFPSLNDTNSRANSIVSSAFLSTSTAVTNNTSNSRRRRPRPWDNYDAKSDTNGHGGGGAGGSKNSNNDNVDVETTPLLPSRPPSKSIHSIKTAKRGNVNGNGRKRIIPDEEHEFESGRESRGGKVFPDHYGSINGMGDGGADANANLYTYHTPQYNGLRQYREAPSSPISNLITALVVFQFVLMAFYNIFLHYQSHRLNVIPPYAFWFSDAGRIYNSAIGPNAPTLVLFGVFHPTLVLKEWWRMGSGMVCCTSLPEFLLNIFWLRILGGMEEDRNRRSDDGWAIGFAYVICGVMGGLSCIVFSGHDAYSMHLTGLSSAGIAGCMVSNLIHERNSNPGVQKYKGNHSRKKICSSLGFPHAAILSEVCCGLLFPYTSLTGIVAGGAMGLCSGLFLLKSEYDWAETDSQTSSLASDLEEAFSPNINTPPRFNFDDSPPPPPSSSSKGLDTPVMRRSILTSPEDDDEYDVVQSLNKSGGKGLKQRNVKAAQKSSLGNFDHYDGAKYSVKASGSFCTVARLRFIGMSAGLLMLILSNLYIALFFEYPSDQAVSDSLYGCKTMHGIYQFVQDGGENDDGSAVANDADENAIEGDLICGETCIPFGIYNTVLQSGNEGVSSLSSGTCSENGYVCNYSSDALDVGFIEIERELFKQECSEQNWDDKEDKG